MLYSLPILIGAFGLTPIFPIQQGHPKLIVIYFTIYY